MPHRDELLGFRFFALSPTQLDELRQVWPDVESRPARRREGLVTGALTLRPNTDYSWLKSFITQHGIPESDYGLFVSVSTSSDSEIVRLPQIAAEIFRQVGGQIDFSFTVLSDD
jgi:hypothetical protein